MLSESLFYANLEEAILCENYYCLISIAQAFLFEKQPSIHLRSVFHIQQVKLIVQSDISLEVPLDLATNGGSLLRLILIGTVVQEERVK